MPLPRLLLLAACCPLPAVPGLTRAVPPTQPATPP
jgi:hypothetical protein